MLTNYSKIKFQVDARIDECGRGSDEVTLVAVSKTVGLEEVEDAISQGATDFGENRPEELVRKAQAFPKSNWHFIGNIQSRQIKNIVPHACMIHSLTKPEHAEKIDRVAREIGKVQKVLVEVNVSGEDSKAGLSKEELPEFLKSLSDLKNLQVCGLMTMAPIQDEAHANLANPDEVFERAHELVVKNKELAGDEFCELSAGMTNDWQQAIAHGSTFVRIGRAIFDKNA